MTLGEHSVRVYEVVKTLASHSNLIQFSSIHIDLLKPDMISMMYLIIEVRVTNGLSHY